MKPYAPLCFLFLLLFASCEPVLVEKDRPVHWTNVPKRKDSHAPIYVNLPAQGDTLEYIGNKYDLWLDRYKNYGLDTLIKNYNIRQDTISGDTAVYKHIMVVLQKIEAQKATKLKIMARPNTTGQKISFKVNVSIFPMFLDPFLITQEPMTSTEGKQ